MIAIITARGGSKGLPGKNIKHLCGKPLIAYTIEAALSAKIFDQVIVTTDCDQIAYESMKFGAEVVKRPKELAQDHSSSYDAVAHVLNMLKNEGKCCDNFMLLQPTSPLRTSLHIKEAYQLFLEKKYFSLASIVETEITPFKCLVEEVGIIQPLFSWAHLTIPRQSLPKTFLINGAIYICNTKEFFQNKIFFSEPFGVYEMDKISSIDIDNINDFEKASNLLNNNCKENKFYE